MVAGLVAGFVTGFVAGFAAALVGCLDAGFFVGGGCSVFLLSTAVVLLRLGAGDSALAGEAARFFVG